MTEFYYLQDSRSYCGNDIFFWAVGGGYTTNLLKAEVLTKDKAVSQHESRETDIPWPKEYMDNKTRPAVDMQYVSIKEALKGTGIKLVKPRKPARRRYKCDTCGRFMSKSQYYSYDFGCSKCEDSL